jgi:hypothetical protein
MPLTRIHVSLDDMGDLGEGIYGDEVLLYGARWDYL